MHGSQWDCFVDSFLTATMVYFQVLDTRDLTIHSAQDDNGKELKFNLGEPVLSFGSKLEVHLPENATEK